MKKFTNLIAFVVMLSMLATMACGCSEKSGDNEIVDESIATEATTEATTTAEATSEATEETSATTIEETTTEETTEATSAETDIFDSLTDEMALDGIHNRCVLENPDNVELGADHWTVESSDENQIVVLFVAYTGAEIRYYIDRSTGDTHVTEFVSGIHDEEQESDEHFNVKDHIALEIYR